MENIQNLASTTPQAQAAPADTYSPPENPQALPATAEATAPVGERQGDGAPPVPPDPPPPANRRSPVWRVLMSILGLRWVLAIPAVLLALYGEQIVEQARASSARPAVPPEQSWQMFALAGLLLAIATLPGRSLLPSGPSAFLSNLRANRRKWVFIGLLGCSLIFAGASVPLFLTLNGAQDAQQVAGNWMVNNGSWLLYIGALLLFGAAFVVWERTVAPPEEGQQADPPRDRLPRWLDWVIMLALFGAALYLRTVQLDTIPPGFWFDEAQNGLVGRGLLGPNDAHPTFLGDFTQMGALFFYFVGLTVKLFGNHIWVTRILPAVLGALIVPLIYMLGSRVFGWRAGLAAGGLLAVSAWNITFSRFGIASLPTVALDVAAYLCIAQALRTGRLGYYAASGVLLGLALHMYYAGRLVPIVLIVLLVHRLLTQRLRLIRALRAGLVVFALGAILAFLPVGLFALQRPELYNARTDNVSIFNPGNNGGNLEATFNRNLQAHLLMFNWVGDGNGRHNVPGTPMLDWITAALMFAGLASCAFRAWRWQYMFPIVWFIAGLSGGVLSLPFEAPQSHRSLEDSVVSALIAGIFIGEAWQVLAGAAMVERIRGLFRFLARRRGPTTERAMGWPVRVAWAVSAAAVLFIVWTAGGINYNKYFNVHAQDMGVWKDMYSPQAETARTISRYAQDHDIYVTAIYRNAPPSMFLVPGIETLPWPGMQALPLAGSKSGGAVVILDPPSAADVNAFARIYPHAKFEIYTSPRNPEALLYSVVIPASDISQVFGVRVRSQSEAQQGQAGKTVPEFAYDTSKSGSGAVKLSATLKTDVFGHYGFVWSGVGGEVVVDGYTIKGSETLTMAAGLHTVEATLAGGSNSAPSQLMWLQPDAQAQPIPANHLFDPLKVEPHGLTGLYRQGQGFEGNPSQEKIDPAISFYFQETTLPRPYTVEWSGRIYIPIDGAYSLGTEQLTRSVLALDGKEILSNMNINSYQETRQELKAGWHDINLKYSDLENYSHMYLYWTPPDRPRSIIPSGFLWPQMGRYPDVSEKRNWPTLEQSQGTDLPRERVVYTVPQVTPEPEQPPQQPPPAAGQPSGNNNQNQQPSEPQPTPLRGKQAKPEMVMGTGGELSGRPRAVASDKDGNIYIFTEKDSKIHKFDRAGKQVKSWDAKSPDGKPLTEASALAVKDDKLYLLDSQASDLAIFTLDGDPAGRTHLCQCFFPRWLSVARDGNFWIANTGGGQALKLSPEGKELQAIGESGSEVGKFQEPASVYEAEDGSIYVADIANKRVQSFSADGKPLAQWPIGNSVARDGDRITGDSKGNVIVTQWEGSAVVMYDKQGKELDRWVYRLNGSNLVPSGIAPLGGDRFVVLYPDGNVAAVLSTK